MPRYGRRVLFRRGVREVVCPRIHRRRQLDPFLAVRRAVEVSIHRLVCDADCSHQADRVDDREPVAQGSQPGVFRRLSTLIPVTFVSDETVPFALLLHRNAALLPSEGKLVTTVSVTGWN